MKNAKQNICILIYIIIHRHTYAKKELCTLRYMAYTCIQKQDKRYNHKRIQNDMKLKIRVRETKQNITMYFFLPVWFVCFKHCFSCKQIM